MSSALNQALICITVILLWSQEYLCMTALFEKVICTTYDANFSNFDVCELKFDKQQKMSTISLSIRLKQLPVTNCKIEAKLISSIKTQSVIQLFNGNWDACKFMEGQKRFKLLGALYNHLSPYTNMNHTCPYKHDIHLYNSPARLSIPLPVPSGKYEINTDFLVDKKPRLGITWVFKTT